MLPYPTSMIMIGAATAIVIPTIVSTMIARAGFPLPPAGRRIGCIDGLRGYLALSVLIHHFIIWMQVTRLNGSWDPPSVNLFNQLGAGGVVLFFMTTGFVFYPRILAGFRSNSWLAIYITRAFRILPLVIFSVIVITSIISLRTGRSIDDAYPLAALKWVATWFSTMNEPPLLGYPDSGRLNAYVLWSLSYEWLFYLIVLPACSIVMDVTNLRSQSWVVPAILLLLALAARVLHFADEMPFLRYLPMFAIGMLAFECQRNERIRSILQTRVASIAASVALAVGLTFAQTPYTFAMPLFAIFFTCVACGNSLGGVLKLKGALVLGECSYGIYLLHGILLSIVFSDLSMHITFIETKWLPILLPIVAVTVTLITPITYLMIERPAIRIGSTISKYWTGRRQRTDSPELEVAP